MITRRQAIKTGMLASAALARTIAQTSPAAPAAAPVATGPFTLPPFSTSLTGTLSLNATKRSSVDPPTLASALAGRRGIFIHGMVIA